MSWPTPQDFNEAIQNPRLNLSDPEIQASTPEVNKFGIPVARSGAFANVYKLQSSKRVWAVKFFLTESIDRQQRYDEVGRYLDAHRLPYMIEFQLQPLGVRVRGQRYPLLKMEWVQGETLDIYVQQHLKDPAALATLACDWLQMVKTLQEFGIAHGDLQHGNILVVNGSLRLIDYDDMYVPALAGRQSPETGNRNYQHPGRNGSHFGPYVDHFSAWIIYLSLLILSAEPSLWSLCGGGGERLLFSADDFRAPDRSLLLQRLEASNDELLDRIPYLIRDLLVTDVAQVPPLGEVGRGPKSAGPRIAQSTTPWWQTAGPAEASEAKSDGVVTPGAAWVLEHLTPFIEVDFTRSVFYLRALLLVDFGTLLAILALAYFTLVPMAIALGGASIAGPIAILAIAASFRAQPEVRERRKVLVEHKRARVSADAIRRRIADLEKREREALRDEKKAIGAVEVTQRENLTQERSDLAKLDNNCFKRVTEINTKRQNLAQSRSGELAESLRAVQENWLNDGLSRHDLQGAKISGIGPELGSRLIASGIRTAADVLSYGAFSSGYGMASKTILHLRSGHSVSVPGIGDKKAVALLLWRQKILTELQKRQPNSLPASIASAIASKYDSDLRNLDSEESTVRRDTKAQKEAIQAQYSQERVLRVKKIRDVREKVDSVKSEIQAKRQTAQSELRTVVFKVGNLERQVRAYARVSGSGYVRLLLGVGR
ncbi:MAG: hypothetical protein WCD12_17150 [Candidatus Binatus sp.]|uniref:protein kinase domain-containing protein n=1 Tax=Candidatus Binatus sp. TaxID=2811406 RepID=UPI003C72EEE2